MALITCPDCARVVSDAAISCPDCARPIAATQTAARASGDRRLHVASNDTSPSHPLATPRVGLDPSHRSTSLVQSPPTATTHLRDKPDTPRSSKRCSVCGQDVAADFFRTKEGPGVYICVECQDQRTDEALRRRTVTRSVLRGAVMILALVVLVTGLVAGTAEFANNTRTPKSNSRVSK